MNEMRTGLLAELRHRKVFRVAVVYAATAFVVLQVADLFTDSLGLPEWFLPAITVLLILGFPVALVLAWALELTPDGVRVTEARAAIDGDPPLPSLLGKRTVLTAALLVTLGVGLGAGWLLKPGGPVAADGSSAGEPRAGGPQADQSIAVLAFADLSPGGDQAYFADGIAEEILNALVGVEGLKVAGRTSSFYFKGRDEDLRSIGAALGVAHILEGSVRKQGERVRISAQLVRSDDGFHLWSETYDGDVSDVFELQERIARAITDELEVVLRGGQLDRLVQPATRDPEAYALYLEATGIFNRRDGARFPEAVAKLERALELDPDFARAHSRLAVIHVLAPLYTLRAHSEAMAAAERHARLALEMDPAMAEPHAVLAYGFLGQRRFVEAHDAFERALERNPDDLTAMFWFATLLRESGYLARSEALLDRVLALDPLMPNALVWRAFAYLDDGDFDSAERLLRRADEVGLSFVGIGLSPVEAVRGRQAEAVRSLAEGLDALMPGQPADFAGTLAHGIIEGGAARETALRRIGEYLATDPGIPDGAVLYALVRMGEAERALTLARDRKTSNDGLFLGWAVWAAWGQELRRLPAFAEFARRTGMAELWDLHGPPDSCRRVAPREYVCD